MDFDTGRRELDSMADEEAARYKRPTTLGGKVRPKSHSHAAFRVRRG